jgi:hypothetical protein
MTNFLPAGIINENLEEILKRIDSLRELAHNNWQRLHRIKLLIQQKFYARIYFADNTRSVRGSNPFAATIDKKQE